MEDAALRAEADRLRAGFTDAPCGASGSSLTAQVFSIYPLSVKSEITVSKGSLDGVGRNAAALLGCSIFLGRTTQVFEAASVVQTIFDPAFEVPVQISERRVQGLLQGGAEPRVALVEKPIERGEKIFVVGVGYPHGLLVGSVGEVRAGVGGVLKEAELMPAFSVGELRRITILR